MAKIIVTVPFNGAPDGQHYPRRFEKGDELAGDLARVALAAKWAEDAEETEGAGKAAGGASKTAK